MHVLRDKSIGWYCRVVLLRRMRICILRSESRLHRFAAEQGKIQYVICGAGSDTFSFRNDNPVGIDTIVVSAQHDENITQEALRSDIIENVIQPIIPEGWLTAETKIYVNPTGRFIIGGPVGDSGLTGRKIIVDTYGGSARHGGGAFSGKDPTKVDRSAAYAARHAAKNIVAAGLAEKAEIQIAYAIGVASPVSINVNTFGTGIVSDEKIQEAVSKVFDFRPGAIINHLKLRHPIYRNTAAYGHFGRTTETFTWENTDIAPKLREAAEVSHE